MPSATYETVLPDGISAAASAEAYRDQLYAQRSASGRKAPDQGPKHDDQPAAPQKKLTDSNKPLIAGLLVIIVILVAIVTVQVVKKREADAVEAANLARHASQQPPPVQNQGYTQAQSGRVAEGIADRMAAHVTQKGRAVQQRVGQAVASTLGRQTTDDRRQLATIVETAEENAETEDMRPVIAAALAKDAEETPMCSGSEIVRTADQAARAELAAESSAATTMNESLMEHKIAEDDDDTPVCIAVLQTGQRAGQVCCRKVKPGTDLCPNHTKKESR